MSLLCGPVGVVWYPVWGEKVVLKCLCFSPQSYLVSPLIDPSRDVEDGLKHQQCLLELCRVLSEEVRICKARLFDLPETIRATPG